VTQTGDGLGDVVEGTGNLLGQPLGGRGSRRRSAGAGEPCATTAPPTGALARRARM